MKKKQKRSILTYIGLKKGKAGLYIFLMLIHNLLNMFVIFKTSQFISLVTEKNYDAGVNTLVILTSVLVVSRLICMVAVHVYIKTMAEVSLEIKKDLASHCFKLASKTFNDESAGMFITRITRDPDEAMSRMSELVESLANVLTFSVAVIYITFSNLWIGLTMVGGFIILYFLETFKVSLFMKNTQLEKNAFESTTSLTNEILRSEKDIKSLDLEESLKEAIDENYSTYKNIFSKKRRTNTYIWSSRNIFIAILAMVQLLIGIFLVKRADISIAAFMFLLLNKDSLREMVWDAGHVFECIAEAKIASKRMFDIFDDEKFPTEKFGTAEMVICEGNIKFNNVGFKYAGGKDQEPNKVFENLSFEIEQNKTVAFVGKSGSGKTTILNLISKLYDADSGEILIDNIDINSFSKASLRRHISLVNQFPYIFNASIKKNLLMAKKDATDEEIKDALKKACLLNHIKNLPEGIETIVGESGVKLSGGQRQRLAIARALLRNSKIILFDESTSSLDNQTQKEIKKSIEGLSKKHTVVIVAHRLSTIKNCDKIFFIDNGTIVDTGTFEELSQRNEDFETFFKAEN